MTDPTNTDDAQLHWSKADPGQLLDWQLRDAGASRLYGLSSDVSILRTRMTSWLGKARLNVLVTGKTGTGKERVVTQIARDGGCTCKKGNLLIINCAELSPALIESELFGHMKGAFTGAEKNRRGLVRTAQGGAVFLDELAALPEHLQAQLLRVMEHGVIRPVGSDSFEPLDDPPWILAATNKPGKLRGDLCWRFQQRIHLPALRERPSDIFPVLYGLLEDTKAKDASLGGAEWTFTAGTLVRMLFSRWRGNVREMKNTAAVSIALWKDNMDAEPGRIPFCYRPSKDAGELVRDTWAVGRLWENMVEAVKRAPGRSGIFPPARLEVLAVGARGPHAHVEAPGSAMLSCAEAMHFLALLVEGSLRDKERDIHRLIAVGKFMRLDEHRRSILRLPPDIAALYNANGSRKRAVEQSEPDLTSFTEDGLLRLYYERLWQAAGGVKTAVAEMAGVSAKVAGKRLDALGIAPVKCRSGNPECPDGH